MSAVDIFDLVNQEDLPENIRISLKTDRNDVLGQAILDLFAIKNVLTLDEVILGLWRRSKITLKRSQVNTKLYNMTRFGDQSLISVVGKRGCWSAKKKGN